MSNFEEITKSQLTLDNASEAIFWVDSQARFRYANDAACRMYGYLPEKILSISLHDIESGHEGDFWQEFFDYVKQNKIHIFKSRHRTKDGRIFSVEGSANLIELGGEEYVCCIVRHVSKPKKENTALLESEQRFRDIFNAVNDSVFIIDPDNHTVVDFNENAVQALGFDRSELTGLPIERLHPQEIDQLKQTLAKVVKGESVQTDEFSCLKKDNCRMPAEISFTPVSLDSKTYVLAMARDITERKQSEASLHTALAEVKQLRDRLQAENTYLQSEIKLDHNFEEIITRSAAFKKVLGKVEQVASTDATVLILGETGTGKELVARAVHNISGRKDRPLVKVNCATLPANLIESELFGHEKGAFTGAISKKIGRFELADGGTIFLDEIGDLALELQSKLLRVLQEGEFERLGSSLTFQVNVRVIAATNRDLEEAVGSGGFRQDLYYRLNVFPIKIPPLRERKDDIKLLVSHFIKKYSPRMGKHIDSVPPRVLETLVSYHWPGNVRELENIIERGVILSRGRTLGLGDWLPSQIDPLTSSRLRTMEEIERKHICEALESTGWRVSGVRGAAKILGLKPTTLEARIKKLGITRSSQ
ncbi:MAG: sigma 54-interacting transcriptional regulator [candidate division Zixibacteria bacterium]|nr:sigma 54-interacting transcriptional regulator [candidate division Zixibacteria bacterium]